MTIDQWAAIETEREALIADLERLSPEQWDVQSLCDAWRVRDVVAHLTAATNPQALRFLAGVVRSGFSFNRHMAHMGRRLGEAPPETLLSGYRAVVGSRRHPPVTKPLDVLTDTLVHSQDIRRPLGLTRAFPPDSLRGVADHVKGIGFPLGAKRRIAGLRLRATDVEWSTGDGPEIHGTAEALIMMMAGRRAADADLAGEGIETLAARP